MSTKTQSTAIDVEPDAAEAVAIEALADAHRAYLEFVERHRVEKEELARRVADATEVVTLAMKRACVTCVPVPRVPAGGASTPPTGRKRKAACDSVYVRLQTRPSPKTVSEEVLRECLRDVRRDDVLRERREDPLERPLAYHITRLIVANLKALTAAQVESVVVTDAAERKRKVAGAKDAGAKDADAGVAPADVGDDARRAASDLARDKRRLLEIRRQVAVSRDEVKRRTADHRVVLERFVTEKRNGEPQRVNIEVNGQSRPFAVERKSTTRAPRLVPDASVDVIRGWVGGVVENDHFFDTLPPGDEAEDEWRALLIAHLVEEFRRFRKEGTRVLDGGIRICGRKGPASLYARSDADGSPPASDQEEDDDDDDDEDVTRA